MEIWTSPISRQLGTLPSCPWRSCDTTERSRTATKWTLWWGGSLWQDSGHFEATKLQMSEGTFGVFSCCTARSWVDWYKLGVCVLVCVCQWILPGSWLVTVQTSFFRLSFHCYVFFPAVISFLFSTLCTSAFSWWGCGSQFALFHVFSLSYPASCAMLQLIFTFAHVKFFTEDMYCMCCC